MTEHDFDQMLRAALLESAAKRWTLALEDGPDLVWPPKFPIITYSRLLCSLSSIRTIPLCSTS